MPPDFCRFCHQKLMEGECTNHPNVSVIFWREDNITMESRPTHNTFYKAHWYPNNFHIYRWIGNQIFGDELFHLPNYPLFPPEQFQQQIQRFLKLLPFS